MDTSKLKNFAQYARRFLRETVSTKLKIILASESAARRQNPEAVAELEKEIQSTSQDHVVEKVAYIWFNRFCALRFMDVNRYNRTSVLSPLEGQFQPEILTEVKMGVIDDTIIPQDTATKIVDLIHNKIPSDDPQNEAYRLIVVAVCNHLNTIMPFLFQRIADYTELLMPDDLLSGNSIISYVREAMTPDACKDVEVIGWLYQFYISEKKDEVFAGLKKNKKVTPENIPAATQLFTPNWIVRYLVENSLGRLWMLNNPNSRLIDRMEYYIKPEEEETDFLVIKSPEEIKICDPACGSGHMLVYAFEILYAIYEEEGYDAPLIPKLILENNLYGIEIDERAGELAAFALCMKAREKYRRFFKKSVQPNICVLENITFEEREVKSYLEAVNPDLFSTELSTLLYQFKEADNFGSLIQPAITNIPDLLRRLDEEKVSNDIFLQGIHQRVLKILKQAEYLSPQYHVVVANPPYMGIGKMNERLKVYIKDFFKSSKNDLYSMFIERNLELVVEEGHVAMITMQSWMYLSRFENFRRVILNKSVIMNFLHLGKRAFDSISGEVVQTAAFVLKRASDDSLLSTFVDLSTVDGEKNKAELFKKSANRILLSAGIFKKIPGWPLTYKMTKNIFDLFERQQPIEKVVYSSSANVTGNNDRFLKQAWEISFEKLTFKAPYEWIPCAKGGEKRKWYGNFEFVIAWSEKTHQYYRKTKVCRYVQQKHWNKEGLTWSRIASAENISFRVLPKTATFETAGMTLFPCEYNELSTIIGYLNSTVASRILKWLNPTLTLQMRDVLAVPFVEAILDDYKLDVSKNVEKLISIAKSDWDSYEVSWDFKSLSLLNKQEKQGSFSILRFSLLSKLDKSYSELRSYWQKRTFEMQRLEEENNRIFIKAYGLEDELTPDVPLHEITLTCNPHYRYAQGKTEEEYETLLKADTMKELISYSVGCMMGRYSLDEPGLIYAHSGNVGFDPSRYKTFPADDDGVIPIMDVDWFSDDIVEQFKRFLKVTFGEDHYTENLEFIEKAIGKDIRKFFLKDFYTYHVKMYKKRPIYWLFSSPKGSFNALIYLHRYRPDTVSIVLNDYLREFRTKLAARKENLENISISASASQTDKTRALKEIEKIKKVLDELDEYERDILYPLATKQVEIDLDDGVKVNYPKFGKALKKVVGLS